ncbi:MAG TPA: NADH-quinone oxidoreductase subunit I, partial [Anaerolineales bacterium]|nr:NADH-quinone oxidoreductase subunit I [Anaerolineales bacterium]
EACPTEAIVLGDNYELSFYDRRSAIYTKDMLLESVASAELLTPQKTEPGKYTRRSVPEMNDPQD